MINNPNVQTWYECNKCDETFSTKSRVRKHYTKHLLNRVYKCHGCCQRFIRREDRDRHMCRYKDILRWYMCNECDKVFLTKTKLNKHIMNHKLNKVFKCQDCYRKFTHKEDKDRHTCDCKVELVEQVEQV